MGPYVGLGKMKTKTWNVLFSNAHSLRGLELSYLNLMEVKYTVLLSSNFRAWAVKLSEHLKKEQNLHEKMDKNMDQKAINQANKKDQNSIQTSLHGEKTCFFVRLYHCML